MSTDISWRESLRKMQKRSMLVTSSAEPSSIDWTTLFYVGGASVVALHMIALPFIAPAFRRYCLPYVSANAIQMKMLAQNLQKNNAKRIVDLGSGDGVVCIELAQNLGIKAIGYELNPWLVLVSKIRARMAGVSHLTEFHQKDLFKGNVTNTDGVVLFVVPSMMRAIELKLEDELDDDAKVYAARFPLDTWKEEHYESGAPTGGYNVNQLWVYSKPPVTSTETKTRDA